MSIDIICPLYNAEKYILSLNNSLKKQRKVKINKIFYILTESDDETEMILINNNIDYEKISTKEFSHSLTRERKAMQSKADIICFITQDIVIQDELWLYYLTEKIVHKECEAAFSRQISKYKNIEKYTREKNYPSVSRTVSKKDIEKLGLNTFFFSDASSAIKTSIFKKLGGYDEKNLPTNEDMYFAYKLIMNGYRIHYAANSIVYHSHYFTFKKLYQRYKLTGKFMKENDFLNQFNTNKAGGGLAIYVLKRAIQDFNIKVLLRYPIDMLVRYIGLKAGEK